MTVEIGRCAHCGAAIVKRGNTWKHLKTSMLQCSDSAKSLTVAEPAKAGK